MTQKEKNKLNNTKFKDSSSKIIFEDPILCAQFLRGYVDIPLLKNVQPEDIEDVSERYVHLFTEERNSDVVKKVRIRKEKTPFYLITLIEHKAKVDYNVVMQIFRYMAFIWEDYEKEQNRKQKGISRTKNFKYPPILPIIYYEGTDNWTATTRLHDRVFLSDVFGEYIPDYRCMIMQLNDYSNRKLMEREDELSIIMMLNRLREAADFVSLKEEVPSEYLEKVTADTPEYLLEIIGQITEILLGKLSLSHEEATEFASQVKERKVGELFANFKGYDVPATRADERRKTIEEAIEKLIKVLKNLNIEEETIKVQLKEQYALTDEEATQKLALYL